jgi:hypothetical protein
MMAFLSLTLFKKRVLAMLSVLAAIFHPPPTKQLCAINLLGGPSGITDICEYE